jgi:tetratricopeptide (TPR) repeat protein
MLALPNVALLVLLAGPAYQADASKGGGPTQRTPIEDLLERARARREVERQKLKPLVEAAIDDFQSQPAPVPEARRTALADRLAAFGPGAASLLLPCLEPGAADPVSIERARAVGEALARLQGPTLTDPLLAVLATGSDKAKCNALLALETCREAARARPAVLEAFDSAATGDVKQAALRTLIRLGGPENAALYAKVLSQDDVDIVALALRALTDTRDASAGRQVQSLLADSARAQRHAALLIAYYRAVPELADAAALASFVAAAEKPGDRDARLLIVAALPALAGRFGLEVRKGLERVVASKDSDLREAALVALVRLGDRNARRDLLEGYDDYVERNDRFAEAYVRRGDLYLRIEDWDSAIKDYQQALRLSADDPRPQPSAYVGLARAFARRGKLRDAAESLRKAPLSITELRKLADDPDFAELRASRFSKEAFGI